MPCEVDITRYSAMIPVRSERIPFIVHWSVRDVNLNCIYLQTYIMSHSSVREDVAQRKSINECSEVKLTSTDFPCSGSREQWTLCREHVNRNTVHARSALLTSWLSESGVLTKRDMQNMHSGGARGLELRTAALGKYWYILKAKVNSDEHTRTHTHI